MSVALITGASKGLGRVTAQALADRRWSLVVDARNEHDLAEAFGDLPDIVAIAGDVASPGHRVDLVAAVERLGRLDVLINNASSLGPSPLQPLSEYDLGELRRVYETNVVAPLALIQLLARPLRASGGAIINVSSDAAVGAYPGWGGYGSSKAALDQLTAVLAAEENRLHWYAFDPGDMRTQMHQRAFPGEDISDRPEPETVVPAILRLIGERPASGRYRAADLIVHSPAEVTS